MLEGSGDAYRQLLHAVQRCSEADKPSAEDDADPDEALLENQDIGISDAAAAAADVIEPAQDKSQTHDDKVAAAMVNLTLVAESHHRQKDIRQAMVSIALPELCRCILDMPAALASVRVEEVLRRPAAGV